MSRFVAREALRVVKVVGRRQAWRLAASVVLVAGCTPSPAPTPGPTQATGTTATPTAAPATATATPPPSVTQRFEFGSEVVVDTALAGTDDKYVNPGAVIEAGGTLHMFPNLFSQWPGRVRVPHLTSGDGVTWTLDGAAEVLDSEELDLGAPGIDVSTGYVGEDGTWVLYLETVALAPTPWEIWRATAPSPQGPWTISEEPVLRPGGDVDFDARGVTWPSVVRVGDRWAMYYAGISGSGRGTGVIGVAFSDDGVTWTKHPDPVVVASEGWEFKQTDRPRVVATPGGLVMLYTGQELTNRGLATSTDGLTWSKVPGPNIERKDFPTPGGSWDSALLYRGGELEYFLEIGTQTTKVYRATLVWP